MAVTTRPKTPKYWQWTDELRRQIQAGELKAGDKLPSHTEMRDTHGVSRPLVERMHAILEEEGLITREPGRGVFVTAPPLREYNGVLGCTIFDISNLSQHRRHRAYWSHLLDGITLAAREAGRQVMILDDSTQDQAWEKIDGVITTGQSGTHNLLPGMPCVSLLHAMPGVTSVLGDHFGGAAAATTHLISLGHRRIGCLMFTDNVQSQQKSSGYRAALEQAGIQFQPQWLRSLTEPGEQNFDFTRYGELRMTAWLQEGWRELGLTALLCENDQTAIGALAAIRKAGLSVPGEISIIGYDGTEVSEYAHPALTTVEVPLMEIGKRGIRELLRQIESESTSAQEIVLPTKLRIRESTALAAG